MSEVKPNRRHEQAVARKRNRTRKRLMKFGLPLLVILLVAAAAAAILTGDDKPKIDMSKL